MFKCSRVISRIRLTSCLSCLIVFGHVAQINIKPLVYDNLSFSIMINIKYNPQFSFDYSIKETFSYYYYINLKWFHKENR